RDWSSDVCSSDLCNHVDKGAGAGIDVDAGAGCRQEMHERRRVETMNAPDWCAGFCIAPEVIAATQPRLSRRRGDDVAYVASLVGPQLVGRVSEIQHTREVVDLYKGHSSHGLRYSPSRFAASRTVENCSTCSRCCRIAACISCRHSASIRSAPG